MSSVSTDNTLSNLCLFTIWVTRLWAIVSTCTLQRPQMKKWFSQPAVQPVSHFCVPSSRLLLRGFSCAFYSCDVVCGCFLSQYLWYCAVSLCYFVCVLLKRVLLLSWNIVNWGLRTFTVTFSLPNLLRRMKDQLVLTFTCLLKALSEQYYIPIPEFHDIRSAWINKEWTLLLNCNGTHFHS